MFEPEDKSKKIVSDILTNPSKSNLKMSKDTKNFISLVSEIGKNFDEIKRSFK